MIVKKFISIVEILNEYDDGDGDGDGDDDNNNNDDTIESIQR